MEDSVLHAAKEKHPARIAGSAAGFGGSIEFAKRQGDDNELILSTARRGRWRAHPGTARRRRPLRLPLASLVAPGDAPTAWRGKRPRRTTPSPPPASPAPPLLVLPEPASEGTAQITLVATDALGLEATVRFEVQVEFHWPHSPSRGWRSILGNATPNVEAAPGADAPASPAPPPNARQ